MSDADAPSGSPELAPISSDDLLRLIAALQATTIRADKEATGRGKLWFADGMYVNSRTGATAAGTGSKFTAAFIADNSPVVVMRRHATAAATLGRHSQLSSDNAWCECTNRWICPEAEAVANSYGYTLALPADAEKVNGEQEQVAA